MSKVEVNRELLEEALEVISEYLAEVSWWKDEPRRYAKRYREIERVAEELKAVLDKTALGGEDER